MMAKVGKIMLTFKKLIIIPVYVKPHCRDFSIRCDHTLSE